MRRSWLASSSAMESDLSSSGRLLKCTTLLEAARRGTAGGEGRGGWVAECGIPAVTSNQEEDADAGQVGSGSEAAGGTAG